MSADRWEACPRCFDRATEKFEARAIEVGEAYGKIPAEEWKAQYEEAAQGRPDDEDQELQTFREDYEWWIDQGNLFGSWRGSCTKCGLTFTHKVGPLRFYTSGEDEA